MYRFALVLLSFLACAGLASAADYVLKDGYYFKGNSAQAYERYTDYSWVNGYYTYDAYRCKYVWTPGYWQGYYAYRPVKLDIYADDFATQALKVAAARDKFVLTSQANLALVDKLGLNFAIPNYGVGIFPGYAQAAYAHAYQKTVYDQRVDVYGPDPNWDLLVQGLGFAEQRASERAGQVVKALGDGLGTYERVAIARSNGQTAVGIARELAPKSASVQTKVTQTGPARLQLDQPARVAVTAAASCVACHGEAAPHVKAFSIATFDPATADDDTMTRVRKYIGPAPDLSKNHCPPGKLLSPAQRDELLYGPAAKD